MQVGVGPGNDTLTVRTINVGLTLLAVQESGNVGVLDYVPIPVEHAIHPQKAQSLVVGDVVCFSVQFTNPEGETSFTCFYCLLSTLICCQKKETLHSCSLGVTTMVMKISEELWSSMFKRKKKIETNTSVENDSY